MENTSNESVFHFEQGIQKIAQIVELEHNMSKMVEVNCLKHALKAMTEEEERIGKKSSSIIRMPRELFMLHEEAKPVRIGFRNRYGEEYNPFR